MFFSHFSLPSLDSVLILVVDELTHDTHDELLTQRALVCCGNSKKSNESSEC